MTDLELDMRRIARRGPSAGLDASVERSLQMAAPVLSRPVPLWACALAAVIGIAAGALLVRLPPRDDLAVRPTGLLVANVEAQASSFPFICRSLVQP